MNLSFGDDAPLDKEEIARRYQKAQTHFREGRKTAALQILIELNKACPNEPEYLYAIGVIRSELGHNRDAENIAGRLRDEFKDPRADQLIARIEKARKARSTEINVAEPKPAADDAQPKPASGGLLSRLERRAERAKTADAGVGGFADKLTGCTIAGIGLVICVWIAFALIGTLGAVGIALLYLLVASRLLRSRS